MTKREQTERDEAIAKLREWLKPGDTVYTILRHVSRSGMQREIGVVLLPWDEERKQATDLHPNWLVAKALGERLGKSDGVIVGGCGMDMGFHLVYNLSSVLWPEGFGCVGEGCPSNDHSNGDRDDTRHEVNGHTAPERACESCKGTGKTDRHFLRSEPVQEDCRSCQGKGRHGIGHWHRDGGYALRQRWL